MSLLAIILMSLFQDAAVDEKGLFVPIPKGAKLEIAELMKLRPILELQQQRHSIIAEVLLDDSALWHWQELLSKGEVTITHTPLHYTKDSWYPGRYFILKVQVLRMPSYRIWHGKPPKGWMLWSASRGKKQSKPMRGWIFSKSRSYHIEATFLERVRKEHINFIVSHQKQIMYMQQKHTGRSLRLFQWVEATRLDMHSACIREKRIFKEAGKQITRLVYLDYPKCKAATSEFLTWSSTYVQHMGPVLRGLQGEVEALQVQITWHKEQLAGLDRMSMKGKGAKE